PSPLRAPPCTLRAPAATGLATLSLHAALPISASHANRAGADHLEPLVCHDLRRARRRLCGQPTGPSPRHLQLAEPELCGWHIDGDRKSTRLNSSHVKISYAVFCLKKKRRQAPA